MIIGFEKGGCQNCFGWFVQTESDYQHRLQQKTHAEAIGVAPYSCPVCNSDDWAFSHAYVKQESPPTVSRWKAAWAALKAGIGAWRA